jgi:CheY-like chemotaxis protein
MNDAEPVHILIVDDQPSQLLTYEGILRDLGENLLTARSAREALDLLVQHEIAQRLRGDPYPLQGGRCELSALEDEAPLELPPRASLIKPFTFHNQIRDET